MGKKRPRTSPKDLSPAARRRTIERWESRGEDSIGRGIRAMKKEMRAVAEGVPRVLRGEKSVGQVLKRAKRKGRKVWRGQIDAYQPREKVDLGD